MCFPYATSPFYNVSSYGMVWQIKLQTKKASAIIPNTKWAAHDDVYAAAKASYIQGMCSIYFIQIWRSPKKIEKMENIIIKIDA